MGRMGLLTAAFLGLEEIPTMETTLKVIKKGVTTPEA